METIVGIDLGTTNSEVAAHHRGRVRVLGPEGERIMPSCVGLDAGGRLLVGRPALNQHRLFPERTVRSVKRRMGSAEPVRMGDRELLPQEASALILKELAARASRELGTEVGRAIITVPAYFSDAQRGATREAGTLAGLEVVRILNEPTAASLAYGLGDGAPRTALVYDLGGGTFDVSLVTMEGDVTEVLASHGNPRLGGDDFDALLVERLAAEFLQRHGLDLRQGHPAAMARLWWAAEEAKKRLSFEPYATVREEALAEKGGRPLHLELELSRDEYEGMIRPLVESTLESVSRALSDAGKTVRDLDAVLLVGGSTRTPLVAEVLQERTGLEPRQEVDPDLCVALGAGVLASRQAGLEVDRVLVDVSPYSFGISYLGMRDGRPYPYCYHPIIRRNTPLPVSRTDRYSTCMEYQEAVELHVFQGDDPDALKNLPVGKVRVEGLQLVDAPNQVLCRMTLDLDGILRVQAVEKDTGLSRDIAIDGALEPKDEVQLSQARDRLEALYRGREEERRTDEELIRGLSGAGPATSAPEAAADPGDPVYQQALELVRRAQSLHDRMHPDDVAEAQDLQARIDQALSGGDPETLHQSVEELRELLFFVESA